TSVALTEYLTYLPREAVHAEGLFEKESVRGKDAAAHELSVIVARAVEDAQPRMLGDKPVGQLVPAHSLQVHVGQQQVEAAVQLPHEAQGLVGCCRLQYLEALALEGQTGDRAQRHLVIDYQDRPRSALVGKWIHESNPPGEDRFRNLSRCTQAAGFRREKPKRRIDPPGDGLVNGRRRPSTERWGH